MLRFILVLNMLMVLGFQARANTLVDKETGSTLSAQCKEWEEGHCKFFHITATVNERILSKDIDTVSDRYGDGKLHSYQWAYTDKETGDQFYTATYTAFVLPAFLVGDIHHPLSITLGIICAPIGIAIDIVKLPFNTVIQIKHKLSVEAVKFLFKDQKKRKGIPHKRFKRIYDRFYFGHK
jgi:hypothetical protein